MRRKHLIVILLVVAGAIGAALVVLWARRPPVLYEVTFLKTAGGEPILPHAINDRGQVVGVAEVSRNQCHTFLWEPDRGMMDLGPGAPADNVQINNAGQIAGTAVDPNGDGYAFLLDPNGTRYILPAPAGEHVHIQGLNNRGQVVGYHDADRRPRRAFIWDKATGMKDLAPPNTIESVARSINDAGQVVGLLSLDRTNDRYAFLWDPNTGMRNLGPTRSLPTATCQINNQGLVVGQFGSAEDWTCLSMWTEEGGARRIASRGTSMDVAGLDEAGHFVARAYWSGRKVLGYDSSDRHTSYLWDPNDGLKEIHRHLGRRDVAEFLVTDINNKGQITGLLRLENQPNLFGVVLEPIERAPESCPVLDRGRPPGPVMEDWFAAQVLALNDVNQFLVQVTSPAITFGKHHFRYRVEDHLWDPNQGFVALRRHIGCRGILAFRARDLNNRGQIVGELDLTASQRTQGVLLDPVPKGGKK